MDIDPIVTNTFGPLISQVFASVYILAIFIAPVCFAILFFQSFVLWRKNAFIHSKLKDAVLLEITPPKQFLKSPLAMELFLTALYQTSGESTWIDRYIYGKVRPWFSLEIVSFEGQIKFYVWTWDYWKPIVTSYLYAQYPDAVVTEVPDYAARAHFDPKGSDDIFGIEFVLNKPDIYPIKSYHDYNLGDDPKEELKVDPTTPLFEFLSMLNKGEQIWFQILVRAHKKERPKPGTWFQKVDWQHAAKEEIKKLKSADVQEAGEIKISGASLSKTEKEVIDAIEKNVSKLAFDTVIRAIYIAPKSIYNKLNQSGLSGTFRQYNTGHLNSFSAEPKHTTDFDYPWQDFKNHRLNKRKKHIMHAYQTRHGFHDPHKSHFFTLSTESLATIYHFPTETAKTPTIQRIEAKRSEPPANLPI
ncbi:MAG TPA: hypothetical protein VEC13_03490 [Candidatus Paceibacterota bacterium]|nr:hypothetical protein [Candidatus Paceibacterota bacterium]